MSTKDGQSSNLTCSFCGKTQEEVKKLIAGSTVYICDECVAGAEEIIDKPVDVEDDGAA